MPINIQNDHVQVGPHRIEFTDFPALYLRHINRVNGTSDLEGHGNNLMMNGFTPQNTERFIREVCRWGNYAGIGGRIINRNNVKDILHHFDMAAQCIRRESPREALIELNQINQLGSVSFASKHLRFLSPDLCPVLDSVLSKTLLYPLDAEGYASFVADCRRLAGQLTNRNVQLIGRQGWRNADVEMCLFAALFLAAGPGPGAGQDNLRAF